MVRDFRYERGAALIEFAIVLPMLVFFVIGIIETGRFLAFGVRLSNAAHAGAQFGAQGTAQALDSADIAGAACADSNFTCGNGTDQMKVTSSTSCSVKTSPCPIGDFYVQVNASATFRPLLKYPYFNQSSTMSAQATQQVNP